MTESEKPSRRILVIGGTGFAGRHFVATAEREHEVIVASRRPDDGELRCDLLDADSVEHAVRAARPSAIVNLAGQASVSESWSDPVHTVMLNTVGALRVLQAAASHAPDAYVLCASSGDVYGEPEPGRAAEEDDSLRPLSPYAASKAAMEVLCAQHRRAGNSVGVARPFGHLGPGQSDRFAASSFARQIAEAELAGSETLDLRVGDLTLVRDFTDVRDTVAAYLLLVDNMLPGPLNICSGRATSIGALVDGLRALTPVRVRPIVEDARLRSGDPPVVVGSNRALEAATGWRPRIPLDQTLSDVLADWRARLAK